MTLVEMLVAMALAVFMMAILSEAFVTGLKALGNLKALSDLDTQLRTAANIIRRDLQSRHFEGNRKLSELTATGKPMPKLSGMPNAVVGNAVQTDLLIRQLAEYKAVSPKLGYFSINERVDVGLGVTEFSTYEGPEIVAAGINRHSYRDLDSMRFTVQLKGNDAKDFFYGRVPAGSILDNAGSANGRYDTTSVAGNGIYSSQWAEVLYDCKFNTSKFNAGTVNAPSTPGSYNLYRKPLLLMPDHFDNDTSVTAFGRNVPYAPALNFANFYRDHDVSAWSPNPNGGGGWFFNTPSDIQYINRRPSPNTNDGDLLLTNMVSFNILVWDPMAYKDPSVGAAAGRGAFVDMGNNTVTAANPYPTAATLGGDLFGSMFGLARSDLPMATRIAQRFYYDTGTSRYTDPLVGSNGFVPSLPTHDYPFNAIQIIIRVYEPKSQQTRQITIIQDM